MISRNCWTVKEKSRDAVVRGKSGSRLCWWWGRRRMKQEQRPRRQALFQIAKVWIFLQACIYSWYNGIVDRLGFISPVHKTSLWRCSMRAGITRIPLHVSRSRGCVPVDSMARSGLFKADISKLRFSWMENLLFGWNLFAQTKEDFHVVDGILGTRLWLWFGLVGGVDGFFWKCGDMRLILGIWYI